MANSNKIMAAVLENGTWMLREIDRGLKSLQAIVGGYIQLVPLDDESVTLYCNEEGKCMGLPVTAVWIDPGTGEWLDQLAGNLVALGPADEQGDETPATEETLAVLKRYTVPVVHLRKVVHA